MPTAVAQALHTLLTRTGLTIASAESLTVGLIQTHLGSCSGSSAYFKGGICAYDIHAKVRYLDVDGQHANEVNCVSARIARQMALGVRGMFGADIGIATTGYAEPGTMPRHTMAEGSCIRCGCVDMVGGRSDECSYKPFAWVGFSFRDEHFAIRVTPEDFTMGDARGEVQEEIAYNALERLIEWLPEDLG
jgi:PncC family amidohydrolase